MDKEKATEFYKDKGLEVKEKVKLGKAFSTMSANEKWAVLEQIARDLGYID